MIADDKENQDWGHLGKEMGEWSGRGSTPFPVQECGRKQELLIKKASGKV